MPSICLQCHPSVIWTGPIYTDLQTHKNQLDRNQFRLLSQKKERINVKKSLGIPPLQHWKNKIRGTSRRFGDLVPDSSFLMRCLVRWSPSGQNTTSWLLMRPPWLSTNNTKHWGCRPSTVSAAAVFILSSISYSEHIKFNPVAECSETNAKHVTQWKWNAVAFFQIII